MFYYEVVPSDANYNAREDIRFDLKLFTESDGLKLRHAYNLFLNSTYPTFKVTLSPTHEVTLTQRRNTDGEVGS